jgi:hypothetical protein
MRTQHPLDVALEQGERRRVLDCVDRGRASLAVEHRELAEHLAGGQLREGQTAAAGVGAGDPHAAGADDEAGV